MYKSAVKQEHSPSTHATLLLRLKEDAPVREVAWHEFSRKYEPIIAAFARRMRALEQDIADIVQEVLLSFFGVSPRFVYDPARGRFRGCLKVCTWRVIRDKNRRLANGNVSIDAVDPDELAVETVWADVWEEKRVQLAIQKVRERYAKRPDKARTFRAFEMCMILDFTVEETARQLGMTVARVHQAKFRILKAIKAALKDIDNDLG
jgi:RNA polymerase sigma factor (sigma-70 family)